MYVNSFLCKTLNNNSSFVIDVFHQKMNGIISFEVCKITNYLPKLVIISNFSKIFVDYE